VLDNTREIVKIQLSDTAQPSYVIKGKIELGGNKEYYSCLIKTTKDIHLNRYEVDETEIIQEERPNGQVKTYIYKTNIFGGSLFGVKTKKVKYEIRIPEGGLAFLN
jgi:hypothetical protein